MPSDSKPATELTRLRDPAAVEAGDVALLKRALGYAAGHVSGANEALDRVLSCLATPASPVREAEPVVWQTRGMTVRGEWADWVGCSAKMASAWMRDVSIRVGRRQVRALYASPTDAAEIERLKREKAAA